MSISGEINSQINLILNEIEYGSSFYQNQKKQVSMTILFITHDELTETLSYLG